MGKKVSQEEIKEMNELYVSIGSYAGVARIVGRSAGTVKKYIDPDYLEKKRRSAAPLKKIKWEDFTKDMALPKKIEKIFWLLPKPGMEGYYILQNNLPRHGVKTSKSYNLFPSEYLGLPFGKYLELCEESLGAEVNFGKNKLYPSIYFKNNAPTQNFLTTLNKCATYLLKI